MVSVADERGYLAVVSPGRNGNNSFSVFSNTITDSGHVFVHFCLIRHSVRSDGLRGLICVRNKFALESKVPTIPFQI